jgi:hypothetical protein
MAMEKGEDSVRDELGAVKGRPEGSNRGTESRTMDHGRLVKCFL